MSDYQKSIAISLKRLELKQNRDLQKWCCLKGFKDFQSSSWIAVQDEGTKIMKELEELESEPKPVTAVAEERRMCAKCGASGSFCARCKLCYCCCGLKGDHEWEPAKEEQKGCDCATEETTDHDPNCAIYEIGKPQKPQECSQEVQGRGQLTCENKTPRCHSADTYCACQYVGCPCRKEGGVCFRKECRPPDTYTKQEVDARMKGILDYLEGDYTFRMPGCKARAIESLRSQFLK